MGMKQERTDLLEPERDEEEECEVDAKSGFHIYETKLTTRG